ncbi:MAG: hypothetical protein ALAOOOJD_00230 [bacterium]|nr:hypothetical protein [bacterium]
MKLLHRLLAVDRVAVQIGVRDFLLVEMLAHHAQHPHELRKDQYFVVFRENVFENFFECFEFAGIMMIFLFGEPRMAANLAQFRQAFEHVHA